MTTTNDAAERLIDAAIQQAYDKGKAAGAAAERRATVERLAPWLVHPITCRGFVEPDAPCTCGLDAILDAEAER